MSDRWYMTVGYPGGEFARKCATSDDLAAALFSEPAIKLYSDETLMSAAARKFGFDVIRECPPDLVEWLDFGPMWKEVDRGGDVLAKVTGGWLIREAVQEITGPAPGGGNTWDWVTKSAVFIPVQGAQNITVLEARDVAK